MDWSMLIMLANFASVDAASPATISVLLPRSIIVRANSIRCSFWMPNWPATATTSAISSAEEATFVDISSISSERVWNSSSVASTVLRTLAKADS